MREVEVKIEIDTVDSVVTLLESKGCAMSEPITQEDAIFIPADEPKLPVPAGVSVLRIRTQNGKSMFTLKQSDPGRHLHLSKLELETGIDDPAVMEQAILALGFKEAARVRKSRRTCRLGDVEICVDQVENLGAFMEAEKITEDNPQAVQDELMHKLAELGIDINRRVFVGYDVLMFEKYGTGSV